MNRLLVAAFAAFFMPAQSVQIQDRTITLDDQEMSMCEEGGGCVVISRELLELVVQKESERALISCRNRT